MKCKALFCEKPAAYKVRLPRTRRRPEELVDYCKAHAKGMMKYARAEVIMEMERDKE